MELIAQLTVETGEARVTDLAARLGVSKVTVGKTIQRLVSLGLVRAEKYRSIFLTEEGKQLAEACLARHRLVRDFLIALGVNAEIAEIDAEGIEHHASRETLAAMEAFVSSRN
ncbi:MAG: manganese-binding transcriptional regulator MntR [Fimbriimonadaceae bacterium]|nr:manganese-binding transcriptional regulator MntR [Fimbriimonadaceae bacterium]